MTNWWMINTHGDPLGALRYFVRTIWEQSNLDGMLVPTDSLLSGKVEPRILKNPSLLDQVNPFKPLMSINAAKWIPEIINRRQHSKLGAILRPCEVRALIEMSKRHSKPLLDKLLTINIDCLGTYPADEFLWRADRKGSSEKLTHETLQFAKQGGLLAYRYRSACQLCISPNSDHADLNIGILGLPIRQFILITTKQGVPRKKYNLEVITDGPAPFELVDQRQKLIAKLVERNHRTNERVTQGLAEVLPKNIEALVDHLEGCGDCQACLDACPICSIEYPRRGDDNRYLTSDIMRWMISCAGCGMCEQTCPQHQPLSIIFGHIRRQLAEEFDYTSGVSTDHPLPLMN